MRSHEKHDSGHRWKIGIFLGKFVVTGQFKLCDDETVVHARTVKRLPDSNKWSMEEVQAVRVTPWQVHKPSEPKVSFPKE